jgi:nitronate monooxygenase
MGPLQRAVEFCEQLGLELPVVQAPMAAASPTSLAVAVGNAGGMGGRGAVHDSPEHIARWAREFRSRSRGAFQINVWMPEQLQLDPRERTRRIEAARRFFTHRYGEAPEADERQRPGSAFAGQCVAMLDARPTAISSIMGLFPPEFVASMHERRIAWFCCATSLDEACAAEAAGADAIVAQGMEAGGHRGTFDQDKAESTSVGLFSLLPRFADHLRIPIIAAGGIADGRGLAAALTLGASAVQVGTALLRTPEAAIDAGWRDALDGLAPEDTVVTRAYTGRLARTARSPFLAAWSSPDAPPPAPFPQQFELLTQWRAANPDGLDTTSHWAGQSAALATTRPAGEIVTQMWRDARDLLA